MKKEKVTSLFGENDERKLSPVISSKKIAYRESIAYNEDGEIIFDSIYQSSSQNGSGFVINYIKTCDELVQNVPQGSILRVFFHISFNQSYDIYNGGGFKCSRKHLQETLNLTAKTVWIALKWLEENFLVKEAIINGQSDFMVNPDFITIGKEKKKRVAEWNRRCAEYVKKVGNK